VTRKKFTTANENYTRISALIALCCVRQMTTDQMSAVLETTPYRHPMGRTFNRKDVWHIISHNWPARSLTAPVVWDKTPEAIQKWAEGAVQDYWNKPPTQAPVPTSSIGVHGEVREVTFLGDRLQSIRTHEGRVYTPAKQLVEIMGLEWQPQHFKLTTHPVLKDGITIIAIPDSKGNVQDTVGLAIESIPGWVMTLNPSKVKDSAREKVHSYIKDCFKILADVWLKDGFAVHPNIARINTDKMEEAITTIKTTRIELEEKSRIREIAEKEVERDLRMAERLGCPRDIAHAEAIRDVHHEYGVDWRKLLAGNVSEVNDRAVIATELGMETGEFTAQEVNRILQDMGCQVRKGDKWELTELGKKYGGHYYSVPKAQKTDGTVVQQIKWYLGQIKPPFLAFVEMRYAPKQTKFDAF
jgi:hypothetical protein